MILVTKRRLKNLEEQIVALQQEQQDMQARHAQALYDADRDRTPSFESMGGVQQFFNLSESVTTDLEQKLRASGLWNDMGKSKRMEKVIAARAGYSGEFIDKENTQRNFVISCTCIDLHADFAFGDGIEAPSTGIESEDKVLEDWWWSKSNQAAVFSMPRQRELSASLLVDGCLMLACVEPDGARPALIRPLDTLEFPRVITHPDDDSKVLYYERKFARRRLNLMNPGDIAQSQVITRYYMDIDNDREDAEYDDPYFEELSQNGLLAVDAMGRPIKVLRVKIKGLRASDFGSSMMYKIMGWELLAERVVEDQAVVSAATAGLMNKLKIKGGSEAVSRIKAQLGASGTRPGVAAPNPGDINVMNEAVQLAVQRAGTGASDAYQNTRLMLQRVAAGGNTAMHYFGDPENANLATASSMELPIMKHYRNYQAVWVYVYSRLARFALGKDDAKVHVNVPSMLASEISTLVAALAVAAENGWATDEQCANEFWTARGAADVASEVDKAVGGGGKEQALPTFNRRART